MYIYHASLFFSHNVFVLWSEIAGEIKRNQTTVTATVEILNRQNARQTIDGVYLGYIVFAWLCYDADERYWRKCQILWEESLFKKAL